ncbi:MAG: DUF2249 domain-containing protein [Arcobacteraceae bacterium]|nr:DUF2249 domain-containing protein [Arcobacteraceae bacterium]
MSLLPENAQQIKVEGATVPFMKYEENGVTIYQFDSSKAGHPEPMINAMTGLQMIAEGEKLEMINSKAPMGLFPKVEADFNFNVEELVDGRFKITFTKRGEGDAATDFADTGCSGGGCH